MNLLLFVPGSWDVQTFWRDLPIAGNVYKRHPTWKESIPGAGEKCISHCRAYDYGMYFTTEGVPWGAHQFLRFLVNSIRVTIWKSISNPPSSPNQLQRWSECSLWVNSCLGVPIGESTGFVLYPQSSVRFWWIRSSPIPMALWEEHDQQVQNLQVRRVKT